MAFNTVHLQDQADLLRRGMADLRAEDLELAMLLDAEVARQHRTLSLVASSCAVKPRTLAASASALVNVTAEGAPGKRHRAEGEERSPSRNRVDGARQEAGRGQQQDHRDCHWCFLFPGDEISGSR